MAIPVRSMLPVLVKVKAWQVEDAPIWTEPQAPLDGDIETRGAPPVPVRTNRAGDAGSFEGAAILAERAPVTVGQDLALIRQDCPGVSVCPLLQVPTPPKAKSPGFEPPMVSGPSRMSALPVLDAVEAWAALQVPGATAEKLRLVGFSVSIGEPPVPVIGN